jgi:hypothetical protein
MAHVTLLTGPGRRRRWGLEERRRILMAAFTPGAVVANVSREYDVSTSLIYKWRREVVAAAARAEAGSDRPSAGPSGRWAGVLRADAYGGFDALYQAGRSSGPILQAPCWARGRRKLFELADIAEAARRKSRGKTAIVSSIALEAVKRVDALFDLERAISGRPAAKRLAVRQELSAPRVAELEAWMRE